MGRAKLITTLDTIAEVLRIPNGYYLSSVIPDPIDNKLLTLIVESDQLPNTPAGAPLKEARLIHMQVSGRIEVIE